MEYISVKDAAIKWEVSERRVHQFCKDDRIPGLKRFGRSWAIPANALKPADPRKEGKTEGLLYQKEWKKPLQYSSVSEKRLTSGVINLPESENLQLGSVGAVLVAAGRFAEDGISPFTKLGSTSLIRRIIIIFQQANISPIVVVTGYQALEVEHHLANFGVIFLRNEQYQSSDKLNSAKLGLHFLQDKCSKIFFASLKIPMFMPATLRKMIREDTQIVIPCFREQNGHPLLLDSKILPDILTYTGSDGMRGAMRSGSMTKKFLQVEDKGILLSAENIAHLEEAIEDYNHDLLHPFLRISMEEDGVFFDGRAKLLLYLIREFHSVQNACKQMAMSKSKAWKVITRMEQVLGFKVVQRTQGGSPERKTSLTKEGEDFLRFYQVYEDSVKQFASIEFKKQYTEFRKQS